MQGQRPRQPSLSEGYSIACADTGLSFVNVTTTGKQCSVLATC